MPDLVLLHGFTHTGASWDPVIAALDGTAGQRYRAVAPDIRGHGGASAAVPVTLEAVLGDIDALSGDELALCGYSMGGRIALHAALAPEMERRLTRLVLIGASPGLEDPAERAARAASDAQLAAELEASTIEQFAERWAATPVLAGQPEHVLEAARADRLRSTTAGLAAALRGLGTGTLPSLWGRLADVRTPVTLLVGERDGKFRAIANAMAERLPDAIVEVVPGAGHAVHLEEPDAVAAELAR
jgi:2-succinyl-6-hydroxy-2,4-cyclohexadiene-1-carboxylate synthase